MPRITARVAAGALLVVALPLSGCGSAPSAAPISATTTAPSASESTKVPASTQVPAPAIDVSGPLAAIEAEYGVRVGVSALSADGRAVAYRADERFGYASTLKVFAAGLLLGTTTPAERSATVTWTQDDLDTTGYSPVTAEHLLDGLTLEQLAEAAVRQSDNTALNLVLEAVGGPDALQQFLRSLGDDATVVSSYEPELNTVTEGSDANTTTPAAFTTSLQALLKDESVADTLLAWMSGNATGDALIRAGVPDGWVVADRSGGAGGIRNDIAVVTTPGGERILLSILTTKTDPDADYDDAVVAETARAVLGALQ
ncbi:class A beta-lactamase [Herbiconiux sp. VKM Ac-2851]|uniref:class A beta-lactamase n=1 Tax=Herbiconiux sp. VKM Ac-2851 TaxID=2739025 RepID=UPI00156768B5|nr:class A beta-lactamase [Herbiconiux sp. VKM Ac-2851]NQX36414.1 class A beta-lactamase [Herbiconiux sp. VKM Ac-2851]